MTKVYVNYVKLKKETEPRIFATTRKNLADEYKEQYVELNERRPGTVVANKIRTIVFWLSETKK